MEKEQIEGILAAAEAAVGSGGTLKGTRFWKAVDAARADPSLAAEYGSRIAVVDRAAFEQGVKLKVPAGAGTAVLAAGTGAGLVALALAQGIESRFLRSVVFLGAFGTLEITTHSLAHWLVGSAMGMRFTHYFIGGPPPPRPGTKVDYLSYLAVPPAKRALMHASGAVVTKLMPFALLPVAASLDLPRWVSFLLLVVGAGQLVTDALVSTKTSDWKKVKRELAIARRLKAGG